MACNQRYWVGVEIADETAVPRILYRGIGGMCLANSSACVLKHGGVGLAALGGKERHSKARQYDTLLVTHISYRLRAELAWGKG